MPTRLDVLLQRRKSADAFPFHRHSTASNSPRPKALGRELEYRARQALGIIARSGNSSLGRGFRVACRRLSTAFFIRPEPKSQLFLMLATGYGRICDKTQI